MGDKTVKGLTSVQSAMPASMYGLNNLFSGKSDNSELWNGLNDTLHIDKLTFQSAGPEQQAKWLAELRGSDTYDGPTEFTGDFLGVNGLNMGSIVGGLNMVGGAMDLYNNIANFGNEGKIFNKNMQLLDQQIANNKYVMDQDKGSKLAMSDATKQVFGGARKDPGLGSIG